MNLQVIETEREYDAMLEWIDKQFDNKPDVNSAAGMKLQKAILLIKTYEDQHYQIPPPNSI